MMFAGVLGRAILGLIGLLIPGGSGELDPPVNVMAGGQPIDVQRGGLAAPVFADFDGDGVDDLLVGEVDEGRLRIYRNYGTNAQPRFADYTWFKAGTDLGRVPFG
jgi:hypothetical protein